MDVTYQEDNTGKRGYSERHTWLIKGNLLSKDNSDTDLELFDFKIVICRVGLKLWEKLKQDKLKSVLASNSKTVVLKSIPIIGFHLLFLRPSVV